MLGLDLPYRFSEISSSFSVTFSRGSIVGAKGQFTHQANKTKTHLVNPKVTLLGFSV
jgi:hypothetical protein